MTVLKYQRQLLNCHQAWVLLLEVTHRAQEGNWTWERHFRGLFLFYCVGKYGVNTQIWSYTRIHMVCFKTSLLRYRTECHSASSLALKALK